LRTVESAGTSNPMPPQRFQRREEPSFRDLRVLDEEKVKISPRAKMEEWRKEAAVEKEVKKPVYSTPGRSIYRKKLLSGVSGLWAGVFGQSGDSGP